jgi:hypothetical protein
MVNMSIETKTKNYPSPQTIKCIKTTTYASENPCPGLGGHKIKAKVMAWAGTK